jgi:hypothetical protein
MDEYKDPEMPSQFSCEACGGEMYPEYYKGVHGYKYLIINSNGYEFKSGCYP